MDELKVLSETDLFSTEFKCDNEWNYLTKTYSNNSKHLKNSISNLSINDLSCLMPINMKQMLKTQNNNAPWLVNMIKRKFHRNKKSKNHREFVQEILSKPMTNDGISGKWIVDEKEVISPSNPSDDSLQLHHYHYNFRVRSSSSMSIDNQEPTCKLPSTVQLIAEDLKRLPTNKSSKRAQSTSASQNRRQTNKRTKTKTYQEHILSPEEIELREALRIIDLDNIGFFPPSEFRKVLSELGIASTDIDKLERCLPLDEDGHYSIDNLVKLLLSSN